MVSVKSLQLSEEERRIRQLYTALFGIIKLERHRCF